MKSSHLIHKLSVLAAVVMICGGAGLGLYALTHMPDFAAWPGLSAKASPINSAASGMRASPLTHPAVGETSSQPAQEMPSPILVISIDDSAPQELREHLDALARTEPDLRITGIDSPQTDLRLDLDPQDGTPAYRVYFAVAKRFDTLESGVTWTDLQQAWQAAGGDGPIYVPSAMLALVQQPLGRAGAMVVGIDAPAGIVEKLWAESPSTAIVPFQDLEPRLSVLPIDGESPVENAAHFNAEEYPLVATVYAHVHTDDAAIRRRAGQVLASLPPANRDPERLTVVAMTGVTAMVRLTADQMDRLGDAWPAEIVGPELAAADITAISNEVPFVADCETNTDLDNLVFCSKTEYMATLLASGADIIGLTGNHQNDYGRADALKSLDVYSATGLLVYGGGRVLDAALAPLYVEHNGNRLAFLGANSYGPPSAWATDNSPGSAPFDLALMSATIRSIKQEQKADVVLAELQYQESYAVEPLLEQRQDFTALVRAGADIVTGVQSHVAQGIQLMDGKLILYGLGNLYFDQMWSEATRRGLIVKHSIYAGRHIHTQLLPTILTDYGQPRWADPQERQWILESVFDASIWD